MRRTSYRKMPRKPRARAAPTGRYRAYVPALQAGPRRELKSKDYGEDTSRTLVTVANVVGAANMATGMTEINASGQGDASYEHIGKNVTLQSIALECDFYQPQTDASASVIRLMVVYDRQPNGAYPAIGDLLANDASAPTFESAINIAYRERFAVLRDCQFTLDTAQGISRHYETYIKRNLDVNFASTGANIAGIASGAVLLIWFYIQLTGTTAPVCTTHHSRVRYYDS